MAEGEFYTPFRFGMLRDIANARLVDSYNNRHQTLLELNLTLAELNSDDRIENAISEEKFRLVKDTQTAVRQQFGVDVTRSHRMIKMIFDDPLKYSFPKETIQSFEFGLAFQAIDMAEIMSAFRPGSSEEIYLGLAQREAELLAYQGVGNPGYFARDYYGILLDDRSLNAKVPFVGAENFCLMMNIAHGYRIRELGESN